MRLKPRLHRHQPHVRPTVAADEHLVSVGGPLEVVAEVVAELVAPTSSVSGGVGVELRGLEPLAFECQLDALPAELQPQGTRNLTQG